MRARFGTELLLTTLGARGCRIASPGGIIEIPGVPTTVASAVGAGDAFFAAFLSGWLRGLPPAAAATRANRLGAWVVSRPEAVPDYPADLAAEFAAA